MCFPGPVGLPERSSLVKGNGRKNSTRKKITLRDVAEHLGVTVATVSKALRDSSDISVDMRKQVRAAATQLGYKPNIMARSLVQQKTYLLGVIVPDLKISFFAEVVRGIYEEARKNGYLPMIMVHDENWETEKIDLEFLSAFPVDGILISHAMGNRNMDVYRDILEQEIPIIMYDRKVEDDRFSWITINDEEAGYKLTKALIDKGCKEIVFMGPYRTLMVATERFNGYCRAMQEHQLTCHEKFAIECDVDGTKAEGKTRELLEQGHQFDGVVGVGGLITYGAGVALTKAGKRIPEDVVLGEFGDNDLVARLGVPFMTINQSPYDMGKRAVKLLLERITEPAKGKQPVHEVVESNLIERVVGPK